jgi:hypothetical protein
VVGAALDDHVAGADGNAIAAIELEIDLALQADPVVEALGAVHRRPRAGCEHPDAQHRSASRAEDRRQASLALAGQRLLGERYRHLMGSPHLKERRVGASGVLGEAGADQPRVLHDHRTTVGVVAGDDPPHARGGELAREAHQMRSRSRGPRP